MKRFFLLFIILFSAISIFSTDLTLNNILRSFIAIIGLLGCFLYYKGNKFSSILLYTWVVAQIPDFHTILTLTSPDFTATSRTDFLSLNQTFKLSAGFTFRSGAKATNLFINFFALIYFPMVYWLELEKLVGKNFEILKFHEFESKHSYQATILKRVTVNKTKNWYLIKLDEPIEFDDYSTRNFMITPKDGNHIQIERDQSKPLKLFACPPDLTLNHNNYSNSDLDFVGLVDIVAPKNEKIA